jgi:hypothetical protein
MAAPTGLSHVAMTVPPGTLTPAYRSELLDFYGSLFGWREMEAFSVARPIGRLGRTAQLPEHSRAIRPDDLFRLRTLRSCGLIRREGGADLAVGPCGFSRHESRTNAAGRRRFSIVPFSQSAAAHRRGPVLPIVGLGSTEPLRSARSDRYGLWRANIPVVRRQVATHVATSFSSPSLAHVRRVCDLRKDDGVTLSERYAGDYGSQGWGFDSLRAR